MKVFPMTMSAMAQLDEEAVTATASAVRPRKGYFIVFEGIDGSGKSTVARRVSEVLSREMPGWVVLTAEPTDSFIGQAVRMANAGEVDDLAEALLFVADRAEHTRQIRKWLDEGKVVICDRYYASTIAYQGALLKQRFGSAKKAVEWLKAVNGPAIASPDLTLLLTVRVETAMERLRSRSDLTKFEDLSYLVDVDMIYRIQCMEGPNYHTLDANRPLDEVLDEALRAIRSKI
jgi:dTMP kinase